MKKGFTLVELSIVLVIIGLLIGGILAAQSMINTAKIQGVVRQLQQYDVAVANFQTKYGQLPGDSNLFSGGDNDGQISCCNGETGRFWSDLSLGVNLLNSKGTNYSQYSITSPNTELNCPVLKIDQEPAFHGCLFPMYVDLSTQNFVTNVGPKNYYWYVGSTGGVFTDTHRYMLKPADALAMDLKIDDGIPYTGKVIADGGCPVSGALNSVYATTGGYICEMWFEIGSSDININN